VPAFHSVKEYRRIVEVNARGHAATLPRDWKPDSLAADTRLGPWQNHPQALFDERGHGFTPLVRGTFHSPEQIFTKTNRGSHISKFIKGISGCQQRAIVTGGR